MKISAKMDYASRALLELSLHWPNSVPLQINKIAKRQQIPVKFLTQILINLKQLGYVESLRGKNGGYLLSRAPSQIKLSDVITHLGSVGYSVAEDRRNKESDHVMDIIQEEIDETVLNAMGKIDFETICNRKRTRDNAIMFQIQIKLK